MMGKLNEVTTVIALKKTEFINVVMSDGNLGKITVSEIAKVLAMVLPQPSVRFRGQSGNPWIRVAEITRNNCGMFRVDGYTYMNQSPASIIFPIIFYESINSVSHNVLSGTVGGTYEMQCRYKYMDDKVVFWIRSTMDGSSTITNMAGFVTFPLVSEEPPSDAIKLF